MAVLSTDVARIIAEQQAGFFSSNAYAAQLTQQNPYQGMDYRQGMASTQHIAASTAGAGAVGLGVGAGSMLAGGLGLAADFNIAPRALSPFAGTANAASFGWARGGLSGALGMGGAVATGYLAIGKAANFATTNIIQGAQQSAHMGRTIQAGYGFSGMNMGPMNMGLTHQMSNAAMNISDSAAQSGFGHMFSPNTMANVVSTGMQSGQFRGVKSVNEFRQKLGQLTQEAAAMAQTLKISIDEAAQQVSQLSGEFGLSGSAAAGMVTSMGVMGGATGLSSQQQLGMARMGAGVLQNFGMSRSTGAAYGLNLGQRIGFAGQSGAISSSQIADAGGAGALSARYTQAGISALNNRFGKYLLASVMSDSGDFDADFAQRIASGTVNKQDILKRGRQVLSSSASRNRFRASQDTLMGEFLSEVGPEGAVSGLRTMTAGRKDSDFMTKALSGLNSRDFGMLEQMGNAGPMMKMRMMQEAKQGLREGGMHTSLSQVVDRMVSRMVGPIRQKFRKFGRDVQQSLASTFDQVGRDMLGQGSPMGGSGGTGPTFGAFSAASGGFASEFASVYGGGGGGGIGAGGYQLGPAAPVSGLGAASRSFMPMAVMNAAHGGYMGDLPMYGMYSAMPGGVGGGMLRGMAMEGFAGRVLTRMADPFRFSTMLGGRATSVLGPLGQVGRMTSAIGARGTAALSGIRASGLMGMGGVGTATGIGRLGFWGMRGAGALAQGVSGVASRAALPLMLADVVTSIPSWQNMAGTGGATSGVMGSNAAALSRLEEAGLLKGMSGFSRSAAGAGGMGGGWTPVTGTFRGGFGQLAAAAAAWTGGNIRGGTELYASSGGVAELDRMINVQMRDQRGTLSRLGSMTGMSSTDARSFLEGVYDDFAATPDTTTIISAASGATSSADAYFGRYRRALFDRLKGKGISLNKFKVAGSRWDMLAMMNVGSGGGNNFVDSLTAGMRFGYARGMSAEDYSKVATDEAAASIGATLRGMGEYTAADPSKWVWQEERGERAVMDMAKERYGKLYGGEAPDPMHPGVVKIRKKLKKVLRDEVRKSIGARQRLDKIFDDVSPQMAEVMVEYTRNMDSHDRQMLANGDDIHIREARQHMMRTIQQSNEYDFGQVTAMQKGMKEAGFVHLMRTTAANFQDIENSADRAELKSYLKGTAASYFRNKGGKTDVGHVIEALNVTGGKNVIESLDRMFKNYQDADTSGDLSGLREGEAAAMAELRTLAGKMEPEEAAQVAVQLQGIFERQGNPEGMKAVMLFRANSRFRVSHQKALESPAKLLSKQNVAADLFGNTPEVRKIFGLEGSKEHKKWVEAAMRRGALPPSKELKLARLRKLRYLEAGFSGEMAATMANTEVAENLGRILDQGGLTEKDMQTPEVQQQIERNERYGLSGAMRAGPSKAASVDDFVGKLGEATKALDVFTSSLKPQQGNADANPETHVPTARQHTDASMMTLAQ